MRRALTKLLSEDHRSIEKRRRKRRDSNERPNYQNVSFLLSSAVCSFDWSQPHCLSLHVLPKAPRNRRVCSRSQPACWPARPCQVLYNDFSSCVLVCADNDPMPSVQLFRFDRIWWTFHRENRFRRNEKKEPNNYCNSMFSPRPRGSEARRN